MGELFLLMYFLFYLAVGAPIFYIILFLILKALGSKETFRDFWENV